METGVNMSSEHLKKNNMENTHTQKNISFIMPAYNCEATIRESINSILESNFGENDELVIVNDRSTDGTAAILAEIAAKNPRVMVIHHATNQGGGAARNTAVRNARHELIFCLDSDNILERNTIVPLRDFLLATGRDAACFKKIKFFAENTSNIRFEWKFKERQVTLKDMFLVPRVPPKSGNYLFTKACWEKAGGYPEDAGALDTWGFGLRQVATGCKISVLSDHYYFHQIGLESYWLRDSKGRNVSATAKKLIEPFRAKIDPKILSYIDRNPERWFENFSERKNITLRAKRFIMRIVNSMVPNSFKSLIKRSLIYSRFTKK